MNLTELALRRAGAYDLKAFQSDHGLFVSDREDLLTMQQLLPYLLGYQRYTLRPGDTYYRLAHRFGTTVRAIVTANPGMNPNNLPVGQSLVVPYGYPVVPTDVPFTSELLSLCIQGLTARYPFLTSRVLTYTAYSRPVHALHLGRGSRSVLYNAAHHANEWITTPVLLKFVEDYAKAVSENGTIYGHNAKHLFQTTQLTLVPMVNPDGVDLVTGAITPDSAQFLAAREIAARYPAVAFPDGWKANLSGVDLNLNYPAGWEQARENKFALGYTSPAPRDYVGQAPLDQPETAAMAALTREVDPRLTLSYHTQGRVIYWKYLDREPKGAREIGERFARSADYLLEDTPFASGFAGYKDWFIETYDRPGYTVEVGLGENPLPLSGFDTIYRRNLGILTSGLFL